MKTQSLDPERIIHSLYCALDNSVDFTQSMHRIRSIIARLPASSLHISHDVRRISFYEKADGSRTYIRKDSDRLYLLARKRYLVQLLRTLDAFSACNHDPKQRKEQFELLSQLIRDFVAGNLDVARIILTSKQYSWFIGKYHRKTISTDDGVSPLFTKQNVQVRSKSEQNIGNALWLFAVPNHYEERLRINVQRLVNELASDLSTVHQLEDRLFYYRGNSCYWNVPAELQYMNSPGSIWHTYDYHSGCITLHPDFTIMLFDGTILYWEHEGLLIKFRYRTNANERISIMRISANIDLERIIETTEIESNDSVALEGIIKRRIVPNLWF